MKRTPLKRVSEKRKEELTLYKVLRTHFLLTFPTCQVCYRWSSKDVHHKMGRGPYLNDTSTWLAVCRTCHDKIEENKNWAREQGFILYQ